MSMELYKPGQGYWTRAMSVVALGLLVAMGDAWLWQLMATVKLFGMQEIYGQALVAVVVTALLGGIGCWLILIKPGVGEFMIATESEMKKVNWSSKKEITGSTWVVIGLTVFLAVVCFVFDFSYQFIFTKMNVLETETKTTVVSKAAP